MAGRLPQQGRETPLLIIELKIAMRRPQPIGWIAMTIQPSLAATTQPAAQQTIGETLAAGGVSPIRRPYGASC